MKTIRKFSYIKSTTIDEAVSALRVYGDKAWVMAGGTDLLGTMRFEILRDYPEVVINLKGIPELDYIKEEDGILKIGALTRLEDMATSPIIKRKYVALSEAAHKTASPHIREMGTIAGNICQVNRCWYFRKEDNRFDCMRKGGKLCYAIVGENRYHSIFGAARTGMTPCSAGCPDNIEIAAYMEKIREGDIASATEILLRNNPIPAITGRVCPHLCESQCNRSEYDLAVSIREVERVLGNYALDNFQKLYKVPTKQTKYRVAVIGSGPAGLSAAYYIRRCGHQVEIFDKMSVAGGMLTYGIPPYRLSKEIVNKQINILKGMGINFNLNTEIGKEEFKELTRKYNAVFIACGAWKERLAGIPGEEYLISGTDLLKRWNLGEMGVPGKKVAVIGAGNVAIDVARTLIRLGSEPTVIYRRTKAEIPALKDEIYKAEEEGIRFEFLNLPVEAHKKGNKVVIKCAKMKLGTPDESGRPKPVQIKGSETEIEFDAVIKAIGEEADRSFLPAGLINKSGELKVQEASNSLSKGIFIGGDFASGPLTVVAAIASGRKTADYIEQYLTGNKPQEQEGNNACCSPVLRFNSDCTKNTSRHDAPELDKAERIKYFNVEETGNLSNAEFEAEANRCFNCGCLAVNPSDIAPALVALNAKIVTSKRTLYAEDFWAANQVIDSTILDGDEIVTEIQIPEPLNGVKSSFIKFALRKSIDFPILNCAAAISSEDGVVKSARICLNSVYGTPYRAIKAEDAMKGKPINEANAEVAGMAAVSDAIALPYNKYKIQVAKALVKRTILACKGVY